MNNLVRNQRLIDLAERPVRLAEWLFGPLAPGIDLVLMLFAAAWFVLGAIHPLAFHQSAFVGLAWAPDVIWLSIRGGLMLLHVVGLFRPHWRMLRVTASFLSAWHWLTVSISLLRVDLVPGVVAYLIVGIWALVGGIYLAGLPDKRI